MSGLFEKIGIDVGLIVLFLMLLVVILIILVMKLQLQMSRLDNFSLVITYHVETLSLGTV